MQTLQIINTSTIKFDKEVEEDKFDKEIFQMIEDRNHENEALKKLLMELNKFPYPKEYKVPNV